MIKKSMVTENYFHDTSHLYTMIPDRGSDHKQRAVRPTAFASGRPADKHTPAGPLLSATVC